MKITDLGFDCLERCFRHLTIEDLLNVADSNAELKHVARYVFRKIYQPETVTFQETLRFPNESRRSKCDRLRFNVHELKFCLQFLRCFGDFVPIIDFNFCRDLCTKDNDSSSLKCELIRNHDILCDRVHQRQHKIIGYINEFCADTLGKLFLHKHYFECVKCNDLDAKKFAKPFKNVERISGNIFFTTQLKLHELFPNIRQIHMLCRDNTLIDEKIFLHNYSMANCFPYLEHLYIDIDHRHKYNKENFAIALRLSNRIKTLHGNVWFDVLFDPNNFQHWNSAVHLNHLESLVLVVDFYENRDAIDILAKSTSKDLHLKALKNLDIKFSHRNSDSIWLFPFTSDNLQSLTICAIKCKFKSFSNLLNKHPTVKKFKFNYQKTDYSPTLDFDDCTSISKAFPLLEDIEFETTPENVIRTVEMLPSLKYFYCYMRHIRHFSDSKLRPLDGWKISKRVLNNFPSGFDLQIVQGWRTNRKIYRL